MRLIILCLLTLTLHLGLPPQAYADWQQLLQAPLRDTEGQPIDLTPWQGKWLVVNFWASWCAPCVKELPELDALHQSLQPHYPFSVLAVNLGESPEALSAFLQEHQLSLHMPLLLDPHNSLFSQVATKGLPLTWILNPQGQRVETILGAKPWADHETQTALQQLMGPAP
ncbi:TlpA family protein disulfide reductase [Balneatrix alpica]|uniref:TlpA family protein disulfide reductase n=1 Tax=Balneatrix alpica TaxID=75684 RepID=A0ABV5Z8G5_9GAMM|nr:TlpA disulfide reductase family protein [Balneatrix alpica]